LHDADIKPGNILLQTSMDSLSSVAATLSTTNALNTVGQPISQPLPAIRLVPDGLKVKIADFRHGAYS